MVSTVATDSLVRKIIKILVVSSAEVFLGWLIATIVFKNLGFASIIFLTPVGMLVSGVVFAVLSWVIGVIWIKDSIYGKLVWGIVMNFIFSIVITLIFSRLLDLLHL